MSVALDTLQPDPHTELSIIPSVVSRLRATFDSGRTRDLEWRRKQIHAVRAMVREHEEEFVEALRADLGKPVLEAVSADLAQATMEASLALKSLAKWTRPERVGWLPLPGRTRILREPLGVVLVIAPWNYPVGLLLSPLVGALAAGNCAVLKPSEVTAHTSRVLARRVPEYLDSGAVALVEGGVEETTELLGQRFDHIFYTGNGRVGRIVMQAAAKHLTPVTLELGGKSPCIVDADMDVRVAARRIAWGKFLNAGQTCIAPDYVLVHERREEELCRELATAVHEFYGADPKQSPDYARVVNRRHHERLEKLLASGQVVVGGESDPESCYLAPTVLRGVSPDSPAMTDEIFGPILPVLPVKNVEQAVDFVNERDKPLALYVFSDDEETWQQVLDGTSSGGACVNGTILHIADPKLPFGGVGESGTGAYHGRHTFETFSHRKAVMVRGTRFDPKLMYPPYKSWKTKLVRKLL